MSKNDKSKHPLLDAIIEGLKAKKGHRITILDMTTIDDAICDFMVIADGNTAIQVEALADSVEEQTRLLVGEKPVHIHRGNGEWIALDYIEVIVHLFIPHLRDYYNIAQMWADAKQTTLSDEL